MKQNGICSTPDAQISRNFHRTFLFVPNGTVNMAQLGPVCVSPMEKPLLGDSKMEYLQYLASKCRSYGERKRNRGRRV